MNDRTKTQSDQFKKGSCHKLNVKKWKNKDGGPIKLQTTEKKLVIIHPSLACPAIIKEGDPILIYVLTDENFHNTALYDNTKVDKAGWQSSINLRRSIAHRLKIQTFDSALTSKNGDTVKDIPMFEDIEEALENIALRYIGLANNKTTVKNTHHGERFEGIIRQDTLNLYKKEKLSHIYQIVIFDHKKTAGLVKKKGSKGTLYDLSWISYDDAHKDVKQKGPYVERQDQYTLTFLKNDDYVNQSDLKHAFNISEKGPLDFTVNENQPIQNFHPIWIVPKKKKPLNIGHLTDVHVSSRQHAFKKSKAKFIHGKSPEIGPMVNASFDTLKDLMNQFGEDPGIDLLVFTGDLIDYGRNYHPKKFMAGTKKTTGDIWQEMMLANLNKQDKNGRTVKEKDCNGNKQSVANKDDYPHSIDNVIVFSLFLYYYKTYGKPIFLTSGNHEGYTLPYGISSRVPAVSAILSTITDFVTKRHFTPEQMADQVKKRSKKSMGKVSKDIRANEGIAADHNLTMPEAILMYGPGYSEVVMGGIVQGSGRENHQATNYDWFYAIFTPLSDYSFTWENQCFMALQWGDEEMMTGVFGDYQEGMTFLTRASKSVNDQQKKLLIDALKSNKSCNILFTHFTLTNYNQPNAITEKGTINYETTHSYNLGAYDFGTFHENRDYVYSLIANNKINYTLSGHSHRSALYQVTDFTDTKITTKGITAVSNVYSKFDSSACKMIVSSCGGPIGIQNYANELSNWGLDNPSGSFIKFDDEAVDTEIGLKIPKHTKAAKPRLAVALDYADIFGPELGRGFLRSKYGGVFKRFESKSDNGPFTLEINPRMKLPETQWIEEITLHVFSGKTSKPVTMTPNLKGKIYEVTPSSYSGIKHALKRKRLIFMSLKIKANLTGLYGHYEKETPWTFQVEVKKRTKEVADDYVRTEEVDGYVIQRHSVNGEIPDLEWYASQSEEYSSSE